VIVVAQFTIARKRKRMTEQQAREIIKKVVDAAIELAICRHSLIVEGEDDLVMPDDIAAEIKQDVIDCLTGDEMGCGDEEDMSAENTVRLWLQEYDFQGNAKAQHRSL
jgi:hypothetical protein